MDKLLIKGVERTCSNFTNRSFLNNFKLTRTQRYQVGWKHGHLKENRWAAAPEQDKKNLLLLVTIKDPYAWLKSLIKGYKRGFVLPVHYRRHNCPYLAQHLEDRASNVRRLYEDPVLIRAAISKFNGIYKHWVEKSELFPNMSFIKHEDWLSDFEGVLVREMEKHGLERSKKEWYSEKKNVLPDMRLGSGTFDNESYSEDSFLKDLNKLQHDVITSELDWEFFTENFGYTPKEFKGIDTSKELGRELPAVFEYERVGSDKRDIELLPGGHIGDGSARLEERWWLTGDAESPELFVGNAGYKPTMKLTKADGNNWKGKWLIHEQMPINLTFKPQ